MRVLKFAARRSGRHEIEEIVRDRVVPGDIADELFDRLVLVAAEKALVAHQAKLIEHVTDRLITVGHEGVLISGVVAVAWTFELELIGLLVDVKLVGRLLIVIAVAFDHALIAQIEGLFVTQRIELLLRQGLVVGAAVRELDDVS